LFRRWKERHRCDPKVFSFDLNGYGSLQFPERQVCCLAGFSDKTLETLKLLDSDPGALIRMIEAGQEVVSHNMETVPRLYRKVRPQAKYERSLEQIQRIKNYGKRTKTGIMVGLGETPEEVFQAMDDLVAHGCDILTLGQYLQPTKMHLEVAEYVHPDQFAEYKEIGLQKGLKYVESGPLVRSSYHAERHVF